MTATADGLLASAVVTLIVVIVILWIRVGSSVPDFIPTSWVGKRAKIGRVALTGVSGETTLPLARAAYDRRDFFRVCELLKPNWETRSLPEQLLLADAYTRLATPRGDEANVAVFEQISSGLLDAQNKRPSFVRNAVLQNLSSQERLILGRFLRRSPDILKTRNDLGISNSASAVETGYFTDEWFTWQELRGEVSKQLESATARRRVWRFRDGLLSLASGGFAAVAGLAAFKGASAGKSLSPTTQWIIVGLTVGSALVTGLIGLLKPAEKRETAESETFAFEQLDAAMDDYWDNLTHEGISDRDTALGSVTADVRERIRAATKVPTPKALVQIPPALLAQNLAGAAGANSVKPRRRNPPKPVVDPDS